MLIELNEKNLSKIKNAQFASYAFMYIDIYRDYLKQISQFGIDIAQGYDVNFIKNKKKRLISRGVISRNNAYSLYINKISRACEACRKGIGSFTFFIDLNCIRKCFFCFNCNQENYEYYRNNKRDCISELKNMLQQGILVEHVALTGGEPLINPEETIAFFKCAKELYPDVFARLYTCGDLVGTDILKRLKSVKLDEIRFSLRIEDPEEKTSAILQKIKMAKDYIPNVMVEMPVIPGKINLMKDLLKELEQLEIFGINLLEFCFPFNNYNEYRKRGLKIKNPPYNVMYNYWYGGGLPVEGSEKECLELLEFAIEEKMNMGIHYCSLENKHTAQIFQQNNMAKVPPHFYKSNKDFFLKSAKVFGEERQKVLQIFKNIGYEDYIVNEEYKYIEFNVEKIKYLQDLDIEIGIATSIIEKRQDSLYFRELKIDLTYPECFDVSDL